MEGQVAPINITEEIQTRARVSEGDGEGEAYIPWYI